MRLSARISAAALAGLAALAAGGCINNEDAKPDWTYSVCIDYCGPTSPGQLAGGNSSGGASSGGASSGGASSGGNQACGTQPGQCACTYQGDLFCAQCPTAPASQQCSYCPSGTYCSVDPCAPSCTQYPQGAPPPSQSQPPPSSQRPPDCSVDCGNGRCCWTDYPVCCADLSFCGTSQAACAIAGKPPPSSSSGAGGSSSSGSGNCPCTDNGASCMNDPTVVGFTNQCSSSPSQAPCQCAAAATYACFYQHGCYAEAGCQTSVTESALASGCQQSEQSASSLGTGCGVSCPQ